MGKKRGLKKGGRKADMDGKKHKDTEKTSVSFDEKCKGGGAGGEKKGTFRGGVSCPMTGLKKFSEDWELGGY